MLNALSGGASYARAAIYSGCGVINGGVSGVGDNLVISASVPNAAFRWRAHNRSFPNFTKNFTNATDKHIPISVKDSGFIPDEDFVNLASHVAFDSDITVWQ